MPQTTQITHHLGADMPPMIFTAVVSLPLVMKLVTRRLTERMIDTGIEVG